MKWRAWLRADSVLLLLALIAGVAGALLSGRFLESRAADAAADLRSRYESAEVVVAARDLQPGEVLGAGQLAVRSVPKEFLPADALQPERAPEIVGATAAIAMRRGTPVVAAALRHDGAVPRLAEVLADGRRALTIAVDQLSSQAGNLKPGDWVDLYYSRNAGNESVLVPLLQHAEVLAAGAAMHGGGSGMQEPDSDFATITLGLATDEAMRVILAQQSGNLSVVLRPPGDTAVIKEGLRSSAELLHPRTQVTGVARQKRIEVLVGGSGGLTPETAWLQVGDTRSAGEGS